MRATSGVLWLVLGGLCLAPVLGGVAGADDKDKPKEVTTDTGLKYIDKKVGTGEEAKSGKIVYVHYTGWLKDGRKFASSKDGDKPLAFRLGQGEVVKGWEEGVVGMKIGGVRKLIIPHQLAYGEAGRPPLIPPKADLIFEVELVKVH